MSIEIRGAIRDDYPSILELIKELAEFEKSPEMVSNSVEQMEQDEDYFDALVAVDDKAVIGMAVFCKRYSTWTGRSLYLDDLFVKSEYRGQRIGSLLLDQVIRIGRERGCNRIRWQVLSWNTDAINLYKRIGATIDDGWYNCDIESGENNE